MPQRWPRPLQPLSLCLVAFAASLAGVAGFAQQAAPIVPPPPPDAQLSPQAAYQDALHPLEVTRHNVANWSDVEIAAMNIAIANAKTACLARPVDQFNDSALIDLARLCSLGQQWPAVVDASNRYIARHAQLYQATTAGADPLFTDAYVAKTEANLRLANESAALASALAMLSAVPYTQDVADATDEAINYMRFLHTVDALRLAAARQPLILARLHLPPTAAPVGAPNPPASASIAPHLLYAQGLQLAILQQLAASPAAPATVAALNATLPDVLDHDESILIGHLQQQYNLLGKPLTGLHALTSLSSPPNRLPQLPAAGTITALLLFPDWCATCVRLGPQLPETVFKVEGHSAYLYALLAQTVPPRKPDPTVSNAAFNPAYAAAMLAETPTVTVPVDTLTRFGADAYPLLLLTDVHGILRVMQPLAAQDLQPGGDLDAAIAAVGRTFSPVPSSATNAGTSAEHTSSPPGAGKPAVQF